MANSREPLTVIAATCNELDQVEQWLDFVGFADRVVVVDTGSRDGTVERLRAHGVEVTTVDAGDTESVGAVVHRAKNRAIAQVTQGWILDLDLDERLPDRTIEEIQRVTTADSPVNAYAIPFRHYVFGRWLKYGGWQGAHRRLYRAGQATYPEDRAHSTLEVAGTIGLLENEVVHFAHPTIHEFWVKMNRYTSQDAPLFVEHGRGGLRNRPRLPVSRLRWLRASASVFWNRYIKAAGFRDGVPGLVVAVMLSMYTFVEQVKAWEYETQVSDSDRDVSSGVIV